MGFNAKYVHTNSSPRIFAPRTFLPGSLRLRPVPRSAITGRQPRRGTGLKERAAGIHLRLPVTGRGPTLEIFSYEPSSPGARSGQPPRFGHIAFSVDDVQAPGTPSFAGRRVVGKIATLQTSTGPRSPGAT